MKPGILYFDASAIVKLVISEAESAELARWSRDWSERASVELVTVEVRRAVRRAVPRSEREASLRVANDVLAGLTLVTADATILETASRLDPPTLRALDAIHLGAALALPGLAGIVTYDAQLTSASRAAGLMVFAPGA